MENCIIFLEAKIYPDKDSNSLNMLHCNEFRLFLAESEGFEPSVGCPTQHFQCCTLRPLGQLSMRNYSVFYAVPSGVYTVFIAAPYDYPDILSLRAK